MIKNIKCSIAELFGGADFDINFNMLSIFVGKNGTGKTVVLKLAWIGAYVTFLKKHTLDVSTPEQDCELVTFAFKHTFVDPNFTGTFTATFEDNVVTHIVLERGICTSVTYEGLTKESKISQVIFMSKDMRLFTELCKYLKLRKRVGGPQQTISPQAFEELLEDYPIYDITATEQLIQKLPLTIPEDLGKTLSENYEFKEYPTQLSVDLNLNKFYLHYSDESMQDVLVLGAGHQSILNMFMTNLATR